MLMVTGSYPPLKCGIGDYTHSLAKALADRNIKMAVLTSSSGDKQSDADGAEVFPLVNRWGFRDLRKVLTAFRRWTPDIVHVQYPTQGYGRRWLPNMLPLIAFLMGKKVVQTWHEGIGWRNVPRYLLQAIIPGGLVAVRPQYRERLPLLLRWGLWNKTFACIKNASAIPLAELDDQQKSLLRNKYLNGQKRLIVFFGFVYPHKGVELLFQIADPVSDQIVIAGEIDKDGAAHQEILQRASAAPWQDKVTVTGFMPSNDIAELLAVADAVILPFRLGGGEWNTSLHGAVRQGTLVITTSKVKNGYDPQANVYYAKVDDVQEMKTALNMHAGARRPSRAEFDDDEWPQIAAEHHLLYEAVLSR